MKNSRTLGTLTERRAEEYLVSQGYRILERNFRTKTGEIDRIAREGDALCFIEVKYRKGNAFGLPEEAVDTRKQQKIRRTAEWYLMSHGQGNACFLRFDVVCMDDTGIRLYRNAF